MFFLAWVRTFVVLGSRRWCVVWSVICELVCVLQSVRACLAALFKKKDQACPQLWMMRILTERFSKMYDLADLQLGARLAF